MDRKSRLADFRDEELPDRPLTTARNWYSVSLKFWQLRYWLTGGHGQTKWPRERRGYLMANQTEDNKRIVRRVVEEIWNQGKTDVAEELFSPDFVDHDETAVLLSSATGSALERLKQDVTAIRSAMPDIKYVTEDLIAEGDNVVHRWSARGTFTGAVRGIQPTGKLLHITGIAACKFANSKIKEASFFSDTLAVMAKAGIRVP
jgi:predicted ester cyclase